jgi:hypothetical protein
MSSHHETHGQAARRRDLLQDSMKLAVPKLVKARELLTVASTSSEAGGLLRRAIHDLTVGVD